MQDFQTPIIQYTEIIKPNIEILLISLIWKISSNKIAKTKLKEVTGHRFKEVVVGAIIGVIVATIVAYF